MSTLAFNNYLVFEQIVRVGDTREDESLEYGDRILPATVYR
jgi:hypothetical protein